MSDPRCSFCFSPRGIRTYCPIHQGGAIRRATGAAEKDIVCRYCGHHKVWHRGEGACSLDDEGYECDCEAWDYGVNVESVEVGDTQKEDG